MSSKKTTAIEDFEDLGSILKNADEDLFFVSRSSSDTRTWVGC
jgi:hypothetical protein